MPQWTLTPIFVSILKMLLSTVIMGLGVCYLKCSLFPDNPDPGIFNLIIQVGVLVVSGMIIYVLAAFLLRCRELSVFTGLLKNRK